MSEAENATKKAAGFFWGSVALLILATVTYYAYDRSTFRR